jgi:Ras GTPase-activating-like protein IQGAP2/3
MALSKKDLMIHITMNELYNTHSLILQHIETLVRIARDNYRLFFDVHL